MTLITYNSYAMLRGIIVEQKKLLLLRSTQLSLIHTEHTMRSGSHKRTYVRFLYKYIKLYALTRVRSKKTGHTSDGHYTVKSKGRTTKYAFIYYNKFLQCMKYFVYHVWFLKRARSNKLFSLSITANGTVQYLPCTTKFRVMSLAICSDFVNLLNLTLNQIFIIVRYSDRLMNLSVHACFCCVSLTANTRSKFALAAGAFCSIFLQVTFSGERCCTWVYLPSGKLKCISSDTNVLLGRMLTKQSKICTTTRAGFWVNLGKKPQVRGVVKNPIDHPHGGRARTVCKPRSPWGWYTK